MDVSRRTFFKIAGVAGAVGLAGRPAAAQGATLGPPDACAMLVDTTKCIGCRACEAACAEANGLPGPTGDLVAGTRRITDQRTFTVVNAYAREGGAEPRFVKTQCNHCLEPGCASACPVKALEKTSAGPVVYHADRCIGCRYCMLACPFEVPKYEYDKAAPYVRKCEFCAARQAAGKQPACVSVCPSGALQFGMRSALLEEARTRIYTNAGRYVHHIYGEHEVGGTSWLYLSDVPFERLGLRTDLGTEGFAELTQVSLAAVPLVMTLWPPFLMALYTFSLSREAHGPATSGEERHDG
jgi:Fe-S-cluster-containing dehydrogenase component